jgi:hypothetical protein
MQYRGALCSEADYHVSLSSVSQYRVTLASAHKFSFIGGIFVVVSETIIRQDLTSFLVIVVITYIYITLHTVVPFHNTLLLAFTF